MNLFIGKEREKRSGTNCACQLLSLSGEYIFIINRHFQHHLPIRRTIDFSKRWNALDFSQNINPFSGPFARFYRLLSSLFGQFYPNFQG